MSSLGVHVHRQITGYAFGVPFFQTVTGLSTYAIKFELV
jgi:hypothetical protein